MFSRYAFYIWEQKKTIIESNIEKFHVTNFNWVESWFSIYFSMYKYTYLCKPSSKLLIRKIKHWNRLIFEWQNTRALSNIHRWTQHKFDYQHQIAHRPTFAEPIICSQHCFIIYYLTHRRLYIEYFNAGSSGLHFERKQKRTAIQIHTNRTISMVICVKTTFTSP